MRFTNTHMVLKKQILGKVLWISNSSPRIACRKYTWKFELFYCILMANLWDNKPELLCVHHKFACVFLPWQEQPDAPPPSLLIDKWCGEGIMMYGTTLDTWCVKDKRLECRGTSTYANLRWPKIRKEALRDRRKERNQN